MVQTKLLQYFPMIRTREQILLEIRSDPALNARFEAFSKEGKKEFLDICTGERGVKILYDSFFRSVMDPELYPERLQSMLSCILDREIASFHVLESSSCALGDVRSLVIMDLVVELLDGPIINLEVQKIGYDFPGKRAACYAADLTLRQYARVKHEAAEKASRGRSHKFSYKSIHPVYTIVLIEQSPHIFSEFPDQYIHRFSQQSDTGLSLDLIQNFIFIPLDIFKKKHQNENIDTELDAWLTFLSTDEPDEVMQLCDAYPFFKDIYKHIYEICRNTEDIMGIFSEALAELDRNTVDYMIDELKKNNDQLKDERDQLQDKIEQIQEQALNDKKQFQNERKQFQDEREQFQDERKQFKDEIARLQAELDKMKKQPE